MTPEGNSRDDLKGFALLMDALAPWLEEVVIINGRAHQMYRGDDAGLRCQLILWRDSAVPGGGITV